MKHILLSFLSLIMISNTCIAQDAKMLVEISADTILLGNYIQLRYTLENVGGKFEMPELEGMLLISGPNITSSMSMINGEVTQKASYTVYLKPVDIGNHYIGPAYIETESGVLESQPINITAIDNPDGLQQSPTAYKLIEEITSNSEEGAKKKKKVKRFKI